MRRNWALLILALAWVLPAWAGSSMTKGKFDLYLNGVNKGYEKFKTKLDAKKDEWTISSEVRFKLPVVKAKRGYVDLYLYPVLDLNAQTKQVKGYSYRVTYNDFSNEDMMEAQDSATEVIDQDFRHYDLFNRSAQQQQDEMQDRIDLGVNAGKCEPIGDTLHFQQYRFSNNRVKDEPLPKHLVVLDAYAFCLYIPLAEKALAMKGDSLPVMVAMPQGMALKPGTVDYMGIERTPFKGNMMILRHYDVNIGGSTLSSFWVDKTGQLIQVVIPDQGLLAVIANYKPQPYDHEEPRIMRETIKMQGGFNESRVHIPSGGITLGGTLAEPPGAGPFPTILMVQDLEPLDRDGNDPSNPYSRAGTWKQLAYYLTEQGFATLRVDSRGVGESGGDALKTSWADRVGDIEALVRWLADRPTTSGRKVAVLSLGLGGWVSAQAIASASLPVTGFAAVAYPAKPLLRLWKEQIGNMDDPQTRQQAYVDLDTVQGKLQEAGVEWANFRGSKIYLPTVRTMDKIDPDSLAASLKLPCLFAYPEQDKVIMAFHKDVLSDYLHAGQKAELLPGVGHQLTPENEQGMPTGLVDGRKLGPLTSWLKGLWSPEVH